MGLVKCSVCNKGMSSNDLYTDSATGYEGHKKCLVSKKEPTPQIATGPAEKLEQMFGSSRGNVVHQLTRIMWHQFKDGYDEFEFSFNFKPTERKDSDEEFDCSINFTGTMDG